MSQAARTVVDGLGWPECPRWHDGQLWFVDMRQQAVFHSDGQGAPERACELDDIPGGIDWLPDGSLVVVSMTKRELLRLTDGKLETYAELGDLMVDVANDLVADAHGNCYVSNLGGAYAGMESGIEPDPVQLIVVPPGGPARAANALAVTPNGMVIDPAGRFIVAEPLASALKVFSMTPDGDLLDGRRFATLDPGALPDGIGVDSEGCVWAATPNTYQVVRVREGGEELTRLSWPTDGPMPVACVLGGESGGELFVCLGDVGPDIHGAPTPHDGPYHGRIESIPVGAHAGDRPNA
jgi:sugar lactone lactonase YvrE